MSRNPLDFSIDVAFRPGPPLVVNDVPAEETVAGLLRRILVLLGYSPEETGLTLEFQGRLLRLDDPLSACFPPDARKIELTLRRPGPQAPPSRSAPLPSPAPPVPAPLPSPAPPVPAPAAPPPPMPDSGVAEPGPAPEGMPQAPGKLPQEEFEDLEAETFAQDDDFDEAAEAPSPRRDRVSYTAPAGKARPATTPKKAARRATVRHYSRMHPQRVYPLLVLITRDMVERASKRGTDQRSTGPFQVELNQPIEIEPVLPGCDCYPPRIVTRLGAGDLNVAFRVVPHVLGKVDGAAVHIRQDHALLAEIPLEIKVRRQLWVVLAGFLTFALPCLSAILKHFGLNLDIQTEEGFNLYLGFTRLIFATFSPLTLTAALGCATAALWWLTRPARRDTFWDIETIGPAAKLERIAALADVDPAQAGTDIADLILAFPDFRPARVFLAQWHYRKGNFREALAGFQDAFLLGPGTPRDHLQAALAASKLGYNPQALAILSNAVRLFPKEEIPAVLHFNLACYHTRLGHHDQAMAALRQAVAAGFGKIESFRKDPDLQPLRHREDFRRLIDALGTT